MQVSVSSAVRFWAFDLAQQMLRLGHLETLYTGYPRCRVDQDLRPRTRTFPWVVAPYMFASRVGWHSVARMLDWQAIETFDHWVAHSLTPSDVFVSLSGYGLYARRTASRQGALTVCDRGSSHIVYANRLLAQEFQTQGIRYTPINQRLIEKELTEYAEADLITVPSTFARRSFIEEGIPEEKIETLPYGVDLSLFHPIPQPKDTFTILFVGTLSIRKGLAYLLKAFADLDKPKLELVLIGGLSPEASQVLSDYSGKFKYLGFKPRIELAKYFSAASVFVIPSIEEGFGLVQAQAMACGLPVVATTNTGAEDLFTDGVEGFIVPIRDVDALRDRVMYLYDHPAIHEQMGRAALERVQKIRGWDAYGELAVGTYQEHLIRKRDLQKSRSAKPQE